jgi:hypothetical protein
MREERAQNTSVRDAARHYVFAGKDLSGVVDLSSLSGRPTASLTVDGQEVIEPSVREKSVGIVIRGQVSATPDLASTEVEILIPHVNLTGETDTFAGVAILTTVRTSIAGPRLVEGSVESYELRPVAGQASRSES